MKILYLLAALLCTIQTAFSKPDLQVKRVLRVATKGSKPDFPNFPAIKSKNEVFDSRRCLRDSPECNEIKDKEEPSESKVSVQKVRPPSRFRRARVVDDPSLNEIPENPIKSPRIVKKPRDKGSKNLFPMFDEIPKTNFSCVLEKKPLGYYVDSEAECQVYHYCHDDGRQNSFLCPKGTIFSVDVKVCDWWYNVECNGAKNSITNENFIENNAPIEESGSTYIERFSRSEPSTYSADDYYYDDDYYYYDDEDYDSPSDDEGTSPYSNGFIDLFATTPSTVSPYEALAAVNSADREAKIVFERQLLQRQREQQELQRVLEQQREAQRRLVLQRQRSELQKKLNEQREAQRRLISIVTRGSSTTNKLRSHNAQELNKATLAALHNPALNQNSFSGNIQPNLRAQSVTNSDANVHQQLLNIRNNNLENQERNIYVNNLQAGQQQLLSRDAQQNRQTILKMQNDINAQQNSNSNLKLQSNNNIHRQINHQILNRNSIQNNNVQSQFLNGNIYNGNDLSHQQQQQLIMNDVNNARYINEQNGIRRNNFNQERDILNNNDLIHAHHNGQTLNTFEPLPSPAKHIQGNNPYSPKTESVEIQWRPKATSGFVSGYESSPTENPMLLKINTNQRVDGNLRTVTDQPGPDLHPTLIVDLAAGLYSHEVEEEKTKNDGEPNEPDYSHVHIIGQNCYGFEKEGVILIGSAEACASIESPHHHHHHHSSNVPQTQNPRSASLRHDNSPEIVTANPQFLPRLDEPGPQMPSRKNPHRKSQPKQRVQKKPDTKETSRWPDFRRFSLVRSIFGI